jgi:tight adherence protein C
MMIDPPELRMLILSALILWAGASILLAQVRSVGRPRLVERLRPFVTEPDPLRRPPVGGPRQVLAPVALALGRRLTTLFGLSDDAESRLARIHSPVSISAFRLRQLAWALGAAVAAVVVGAAGGLTTGLALLSMPAAAAAAYGVTELQLSRQCQRVEDRRALEMPVVAEQLAMLVAAGHSLGSALARVAWRGSGVVAMDIGRVHQRIRQGVPERNALREWAVLARSPVVDRLVSVLVLSTETGDLGRLLAQEARAIRRNVQRKTVELMDRRSQQVWVPVTVAALVPGVIFLAVPFVDALRLFASG